MQPMPGALAGAFVRDRVRACAVVAVVGVFPTMSFGDSTLCAACCRRTDEPHLMIAILHPGSARLVSACSGMLIWCVADAYVPACERDDPRADARTSPPSCEGGGRRSPDGSRLSA